MKRFVCAVLALAMLVVGGAWAEEDIHLLWGIEFGQDMKDVQSILKNERGVDMEYSEEEYSGALYKGLSCKDTSGMTVLGYPVDMFYWSTAQGNDYGYEKVTIVFSIMKDSDLDEEASEEETTISPLADILSALVEQFGPVNFATYEIFSAGSASWSLKDRDNIHELKHFKNLGIESLNFRSIIDTTEYLTERSSIHLKIYIDNIEVYCWAISHLTEYHVMVSFSNSVYEDTAEDTYEEFELTKYEDQGF